MVIADNRYRRVEYPYEPKLVMTGYLPIVGRTLDVIPYELEFIH